MQHRWQPQKNTTPSISSLFFLCLLFLAAHLHGVPPTCKMPPGYGDLESAAPAMQQSSSSPPRLRTLRVSLTVSELELQTFGNFSTFLPRHVFNSL
jgi:hypothetical protein